ncbi:hypothetical protein B6N60_03755 [Richelia sinica FACHB-800]|uniref:Uncharacterized protein n=1 Tax=Richelia sinica FACHB-800 TaxID=1357546 RepID=A0A975TAC5_9NOST|nr:hypothetical protein [Richelia sinica]MBD2664133.1 hypothetical protein [Richelia sinica FACHB-800]QXE25045.1 hypothetical protein B6N60_03755 [Richelia sinica FACHB-800]
MTQKFQLPNWDDLTSEQKLLFQTWIKSLEDVQAASIELIKSFNNGEIATEAIPEVNSIESSETLNLNVLANNEENITMRIDEFYCQVILKSCQVVCQLKTNPEERRKCLENCRKNSCME